MSKGLDELLYSGIDVNTKEYGDCIAYTQDCIDIIEKELQEKEELEKENKRLANALKKKKGKLRHYATIKKENQELSETLQLYNEKFAGFERVKADLMKENQELKEKGKELLNDFRQTLEIAKKYKNVIDVLRNKVSFEVILNLCNDEEKEVLEESLTFEIKKK